MSCRADGDLLPLLRSRRRAFALPNSYVVVFEWRWRIAGRPVNGHGVEVVNPRLYRGRVIVSLPPLVKERRRW